MGSDGLSDWALVQEWVQIIFASEMVNVWWPVNQASPFGGGQAGRSLMKGPVSMTASIIYPL